MGYVFGSVGSTTDESGGRGLVRVPSAPFTIEDVKCCVCTVEDVQCTVDDVRLVLSYILSCVDYQ